MADEPISALTLFTSYSTADEVEILDVSDTTFAATGTNKRIQFSTLLSMAGVGSGGLTSVGLSVPSWLTVSDSPLTANGTLNVTATTGETANQFLATPSGTTGAVGLRAITTTDLPSAVVLTTGSYANPAWIASIAESQVTNLTTDLAAKATDTAVVHLAGTETITGAKAFAATVGATRGVQGVLLETQSGEQVNVPVLTYTPYTAGNEPFQIQGNSWLNAPTGQGFGYNHSMHFGWNAALFAGGTATPGMPSLYMGFEDNYYDYSGDLSLGVEWYVGYCTPDGTTIAPANLRPFYCRVTPSNTNTADKNVIINMDIGSGSTGVFRIWGSIINNNPLISVNKTGADFNIPINIIPTVSSAFSISRIGTGAGAGQSWGLQIADAAASDQMSMGWSSTAYSTGGNFAWLGNNQGFLYTPSSITIGTGLASTGAIAQFSSSGLNLPNGCLGVGSINATCAANITTSTLPYALNIVQNYPSAGSVFGTQIVCNGSAYNNYGISVTAKSASNVNMAALFTAGTGGTYNYAVYTTGSVSINGNANVVQLIVVANSTQTNHIQEWQNSSGTPLSFIRPDGSIGLPTLTDSAAVNNSLYYSSTTSKLCYKDSSGNLHAV
jgi:hypothetical protein